MVEFKAITPNAEVSGDAILAMVDGLGAFKTMAMQILETNGIKDPRRDEWYLQQNWLNAFKVIAEKVGPFTLYNIGTKIPENAKWPPHVDTIEKALASIDVAYHMNHRINNEVLFDPDTGVMKEGIGHYGFQILEQNKVKMECNNPYPCDFDKGIISNTVKVFSKEGSQFPRIDHENLCRKNGNNACNYIVSWF
ncbi:MAG: hypothetical protein ACFE9Z_00285 [Promethearchaeota archaeon]